jgi:uncharacterized protein YndB with AHSA1/START domain
MQAWEAWARPEHLSRWFTDDARGKAVPGGEIVHVFSRFGIEMPHKVVEAVPGERLVVEGTSPQGLPFRQQVIVSRDGGETVIELVHSGFGSEADWGMEMEGVDSGWKLALALLRHYLEHHWGVDKAGLFVMRPAAFEYAEVQPYYRDEAGLASWLTTAGALAGKQVGDPVRLELQEGGTLTGRLLADSGRELLVSWDEIDGALELKAFDVGPNGKAVCLRGSAWGMGAEEAAAWEERLGRAVDRLVAVLGA